MQIAIIQFPGANCERETAMAVLRAGMQPVDFFWNEQPDKLAEFAGFIIVGGFSYEDRARAGIIAALDPLLQILRQQSELGKPILGICNGAQILVESGLVPGLSFYQTAVALTDNLQIQNNQIISSGFYNAWVNIRPADEYQLNAFTNQLNASSILNMPVAHAEGRFLIPPGLLASMQAEGMTVFQYCDEHGEIINEFPINPNGSVANVAAITNRMGNVMAIMPHPERTPNGDPIFNSMREYIKHGHVEKILPLNYQPRYPQIRKYQLAENNRQLLIGLQLTDNQAQTVQNALQQRGIPATVKRYVHWEIDCNQLDFDKIIKSEILFNPLKEFVFKSSESFMLRDDASRLLSTNGLTNTVGPEEQTEFASRRADVSNDEQKYCSALHKNNSNNNFSFLIKAKDDLFGMAKLQDLKANYQIDSLELLRHGIIWHITVPNNYRAALLDSHILFNPVASDCYEYEYED